MFKITYLSILRAEFKPGSAATFEMVWKILPVFTCNYSSFYNSERILKKSVTIWPSYSQQKGDILTALKITHIQ